MQAAKMRLSRGVPAEAALVKQVQRDLRRLGYLRTGIDGVFGKETEAAIRSLRYDLLHNSGNGSDAAAPVAVMSYNRGRVTEITGVLDEGVAAAVEEMLADPRFGKVPESPDPVADNARAVEALRNIPRPTVPVPFLLAILQQESGMRHFQEPAPGNDDNFVVVGLDRNGAENFRITSRGYGIGQYTLFHHPPSAQEVESVILDPVANVSRTVQLLDQKFQHFITGAAPAQRASDREQELGLGPLRRCKYAPEDPRYLTACRQCAAAADRITVRLDPTPYHPNDEYHGVPDRKQFGCDWPYAVRRYNGGGPNSYHYQAQVLLRLLNG
jgi:peptidoglycan hydrolase-like protein with peptidoglycan-binding domain